MNYQRTAALLIGALALAYLPVADAALSHRYSFDTDASDSVGDADGTLEGGAYVDASFGLILEVLEGSTAHCSLPPTIIQGYTEVTIQAWATIYELSADWTRLFDFGASDGVNGRNYIFLTANSGAGDTRLAISDADPGWSHEEVVLTPGTLDNGEPVQITAVLAPAQGWGALYLDGQLVASRTDLTIPLSAVESGAAYIGRSLYSADGYLNADIDEFRIYDNALDSAEIAAAFAGGPDSTSLDPGTVTSLTMTVPPQMRVSGVAIPAFSAAFTIAGSVVLPAREVSLVSSEPGIVEVRADGSLLGLAAGTSTVTAQYGGQTTEATIEVLSVPAELRHRYSFGESAGATQVTDSVGGATGTVFPAAQGGNVVGFGTGQAVFPGGAIYLDGPYIDLPNYLVSSLDNVTFEVWATWNGPADSSWQRIFDIGNSTKGENAHADGAGSGSFFLTPRNSANATVRFVAGPDGFTGEQTLDGAAMMPIGQETHVVCVYAPDNQTSQLWVNSRLVRTAATPFTLGQLNDINVWLGIANWNDPPLNGSINEFRIYDGILSEMEIALRLQAGPDALPTDPGLLQSVRLEVPTLFESDPQASAAKLFGNFENVQDLDVTALSGVSFESSNEAVFTVDAAGMLTPVGSGDAELTGTLQGVSDVATVTVLSPTGLELVVASPLNAGGPVSDTQLTATYPGDLTRTVNNFIGVVFDSSNDPAAAVTAVGGVVPLNVGSSTISASFGGLNANAAVQVTLPPNYEPASLIHRYSFSEAAGSPTVSDSVGTAHGELLNPSATSDFTGSGRLMLGGGAWDLVPQPGYVDLPNGLVSSLTSVTLEGWIRWAGPANSSWQRIFDFGRNSAVDGGGAFIERTNTNPGRSYLYLSPRSGDNTFRFAIKDGDGAELPQLNSATLPVDTDLHFALVYDSAAGAARLYVDGQRVSVGALTHPLSVVEDLNVYLGRSQWTDNYFAGQFDEFRVYSGTLLEHEVAATFAAGPDALPIAKPALGFEIQGNSLVLSWPESVTGFQLRSSPGLPAGQWMPVGGVENNRVVIEMTGQENYYQLIEQP